MVNDVEYVMQFFFKCIIKVENVMLLSIALIEAEILFAAFKQKDCSE